ncbi:MAG: pantoate--beta-alanine ligase [Ferruginibacter sp.]|nr:pantoate--beta-alanine ligase [Cytophagales bacterium]
MVILTSPSELQVYLKQLRQRERTVGLVPTMGALHAGHASLVEASKAGNEVTVCSIYVNPTQFNSATDLRSYPRSLEADCRLLEEHACDAVFIPDNEAIYPEPPRTRLHFGELESVMEGRFRPGHFNGVGLVVSKLFHMVQPDRAYFGQKDLQQFLIVQRLVTDLSFGLQLVRCPIVREPDGLALSSRNARLTPAQRGVAPALYRALDQAREMLRTHQGVAQTKQAILGYFSGLSGIRLEYFEIADGEDLREVSDLRNHRHLALCIAAYLDEVRLIDNLLLTNPPDPGA